MLINLKETEKLLEDLLAALREGRGIEFTTDDNVQISDEIKYELNYVINFVHENLTEHDKVGTQTQTKLKQAVSRGYPAANRYLDEDFFEHLYIMTNESQKQYPNIDNMIISGTEVLQRLKGFTKVSSPSTY